MEGGDPEIELGATVRWGFTPNLTLSAALNPDFSQVEADALQLSVNRPFAIFFPELRPFFMEGADFFATTFDAVYTRMMREPAWGLKLTGKEGDHTVGAYVVEDDVTNLIIPGSESSDFTSLDQGNTLDGAALPLRRGQPLHPRRSRHQPRRRRTISTGSPASTPTSA